MIGNQKGYKEIESELKNEIAEWKQKSVMHAKCEEAVRKKKRDMEKYKDKCHEIQNKG